MTAKGTMDTDLFNRLEVDPGHIGIRNSLSLSLSLSLTSRFWPIIVTAVVESNFDGFKQKQQIANIKKSF
jgi:hypothetical protein